MVIGAKQPSDVHAHEAEKAREITDMEVGAPIGTGLLGVGRWGKNLLRVLQSVGGLKLHGYADPAEVIAPLALPRYLDLHQMLRDPRIRAVVIATPREMHFEQCYLALNAGRHVFVEKPLAGTLEEARELCGLAKRRDCRLMVGHILRYHPAVDALRALVASGEMGAVRGFSSSRVVPRRNDDAWWCLAPHDLSLAEFVLGRRLVRISCVGSERVRARVLTSEGLEGNIEVGLGGEKASQVAVYCAEGWARFNPADGLVVRLGEREFSVSLPALEPLALELQHFAKYLHVGKRCLSDGLEGARVVAALEAGDVSRRTGGRWQSIP